MNEVEQVILGMSDEDLLEAVEVKYSNFTREALEIAMKELTRRHISYTDNSSLYPTNINIDEEFENVTSDDKNDKTESFENDKKQTEKIFSYIYSWIFVLGILTLIFIRHKSIIDAIKTIIIMGVLIGVLILFSKMFKEDIFTEIVFLSIFVFLFRVVDNFFVFHKAHYDLGSIYAAAFSFVSIYKWYMSGKKLSYWKITIIILILALYIAIDFKFNT